MADDQFAHQWCLCHVVSRDQVKKQMAVRERQCMDDMRFALKEQCNEDTRFALKEQCNEDTRYVHALVTRDLVQGRGQEPPPAETMLRQLIKQLDSVVDEEKILLARLAELSKEKNRLKREIEKRTL